MKPMLICLILVFMIASLGAQEQSWNWLSTSQISSEAYANAVTIDASGDTYFAGHFKGNGSFGDHNLSSTQNYGDPSTDVIIGKVNSLGEFQWLRQSIGLYTERATDIAIDSQNNVYVTGTFGAQTSFGSTSLVAISTDSFLAKLDSAGNWLWAKQIGGSGIQNANALCLDDEGNIYLTGEFSTGITIEDQSLGNLGAYDIFTAKLDANGELIWLQSTGSSANDYAQDITLSVSGSLLVCGYFYGDPSFGSITLERVGNCDLFVAEHDSLGNWQWVINAGSANKNQFAYRLTTDPTGNIYVAGSYTGSPTFGSTTLAVDQNRDAYVAKISPTGSWLWAKAMGGSNQDDAYAITIDSEGYLYVSGRYMGNMLIEDEWIYGGSEDLYLLKLNDQGVMQDLTHSSGSGTWTASVKAIACNNTSIICAGHYKGSISLGNYPAAPNPAFPNSTNLLLAKFGTLSSELSAPQEPLISMGENQFSLSWQSVPQATYYIVEAASAPDGTFNDVSSSGSFDGNSWTCSEPGQSRMFFRIKAVGER